jgi:fatty-acyl-CoA synthase
LTAEDRTYGYLPFFFNGGLVGVALATLSRGAAVVLQEVFRAEETLALLEHHRCTTLFAWPHQVEALLALPEFSRARLVLRKGVGANTKWASRLYPPDHQAVATWGMTETGPMAASTRFDDPLPLRAGSHGRAMPGLEIRIVDPGTGTPQPVDSEGEIVVRGRSLMRSYYGTSPTECFDRDGFFHTGDCGRLDASGHLHFLGRLKDVIKTAGVNVAAAEVEAVLLAHSAVRVAHVVPVPHPTRGENVAAFVVLNQHPCTTAELRRHCETQLASYKVPRHFFFRREDELPVLGSGKVDRQMLRAQAAQLAAAETA